MKKVIVMTRPTRLAYYNLINLIQRKQVEMIRRISANKVIGVA